MDRNAVSALLIVGSPLLDNSVSFSSLCLKPFCDGFQLEQSPIEDDEDLLSRWFDLVVIAGAYAFTEAFTFDKLRPAQGVLRNFAEVFTVKGPLYGMEWLEP